MCPFIVEEVNLIIFFLFLSHELHTPTSLARAMVGQIYIRGLPHKYNPFVQVLIFDRKKKF